MQDPIYIKLKSAPRPTLTAASGFVLLATAGLWLSTLAGLLLPGAGVLVSNALYYIPFLALPMLLYARRRPGLSGALRLGPPPELALPGLALLAVLTVFAASGLSGVWGLILDALGLREPGALPAAQTRGELALSILAVAALPAVCEELLFRGFVLSAWESRGTFFAIGVSAALFALLHGNLYGLPAYLLVGAVSGCVAFATDSVYGSIIYHTLYNAACLVISWLLSRQGGPQAAATPTLLLTMAFETVTLLLLLAMLVAVLMRGAARAGVEPVPRIRRPLSPGEKALLWAAVGAMLISMLAILILSLTEGAAP